VTERRTAADTFRDSAQPGQCDVCGREGPVAVVEDCFFFPYPETVRQHLCWVDWREWLLSGEGAP
jgi:hypothetical protein